MLAKQLFEEGKVRAAQAALSEWLRSHPDDTSARTFLFELLCFSGDWDRAERQLAVVAKGDAERELGATSYRAALDAERLRHETMSSVRPAEDAFPARISGTLNGCPFQNISDADPAIGTRLEVFAAGSYLWISFAHLDSIYMEAPRRLRDLLWIPATLRMNTRYRGSELKDVLLPAIYPFTWRTPEETFWLGRETKWIDRDGGQQPVGQKMLLVDEDAIPMLGVRELHFAGASELLDD